MSTSQESILKILNRLTKKIFNYNIKDKGHNTMCCRNIMEDMVEVGINPADIWNKEMFRVKTYKPKCFSNITSTWSEEKMNLNEKITKFWVNK